MDKINFECIHFPTSLTEVKKFCAHNPDISIGVYSLYKKKNNGSRRQRVKCEILPLILPDKVKAKHIDMMWLPDFEGSNFGPNTPNDGHFCLITNKDALLSSFNTHNDRRRFYCNHCLHPFMSQEKRLDHEVMCSTIEYKSQIVMPEPGAPAKPPDWSHKAMLPTVAIAEFRTARKEVVTSRKRKVYVKLSDGSRQKIDSTDDLQAEYSIIEYCILVLHTGQTDREPDMYGFRGEPEQCVKHFVQSIKGIAQEALDDLKINIPMDLTTPEAQAIVDNPDCCWICKKPLPQDHSLRCLDHRHIDGVLLGWACRPCNASRRPKRYLPVYISNFKTCISKLIIPHLENEKCRLLSPSPDCILFLDIGAAKLMDPVSHFGDVSISQMARCLWQAGGDDNFPTFQHFWPRDEGQALGCYQHDYLKERIVFPSKHVTGLQSLDERHLPDDWDLYTCDGEFDQLGAEQNHERSKSVYQYEMMANLGDLSKLCMLQNGCILADFVLYMRSYIAEKTELDICTYLTIGALSYSYGLMSAQNAIEPITDPCIHLYGESCLQGGVVYCSKRYAARNIPGTPDYNVNYGYTELLHLDINQSYAAASSQLLPCGSYSMLTSDQAENLDLMSIPHDSPWGYFLTSKISWPDHTHNALRHFPPAPRHVQVTMESLTPFQRELLQNAAPEQLRSFTQTETKLLPSLLPCDEYRCHYKLLQLWVRLGANVEITGGVKFTQKHLFKDLMEFYGKQRRDAPFKFQQVVWKKCANLLFGKMSESKRRYSTAILVTDAARFLKLVSKPNCLYWLKIGHNVAIVVLQNTRCLLDRNILIGAAIADLAKFNLYSFYYETMVYRVGPGRLELCYVDTDGYILLLKNISSRMFYVIMEEHIDTSNFDPSHDLYTLERKNSMFLFSCQDGSSSTCILLPSNTNAYEGWSRCPRS